MQQQTIIRGAAIAVAGVAASVFASQHFLGGAPASYSAATPGPTEQVQAASLVGGGTVLPETSAADTAQAQAQAPALVLQPTATGQDDAAALPRMAALDTASEDAVRPDADFEPKLALAELDVMPAELSCTPSLSVHAAIDAMLDVNLSAPCHANQRIVISHDDLAFSALTDDNGAFSAYLPALSMQGNVDVFLADDTLLQDSAFVPDLDAHSRIIVQWTGADAFALHAFHNGASYGEDGHMHALKPFDPLIDDAYLMALGDNLGLEPMRALVYSVPVSHAEQASVTLELAFDRNACGRDVSAFVLQRGPFGVGDFHDVTLATPECANGGDGLVMVDLPLALAPAEAAAPALGLSLLAEQSQDVDP